MNIVQNFESQNLEAPPNSKRLKAESPKSSFAAYHAFKTLAENKPDPASPLKNTLLTQKIYELRPDYLKTRDGALWTCVDRREVKTQEGAFIGFTHIYRLKHKYDKNYCDTNQNQFISKEQEIDSMNSFPASEPTLFGFQLLTQDENFSRLGFNFIPDIGTKSGREVTGEIMIPDVNVIKHNILKLSNQALKERLKLELSLGTASHRKFVEKAAEGTLLISQGHEEVHDSVIHLFTQIKRILNDKTGEKQNLFQNFFKNALLGLDKERMKITTLQLSQKEAMTKKLNFMEFYLAGSADFRLAELQFYPFLDDLLSDNPKYPIIQLWKANLISKEFPEFLNWTHCQVLAEFDILLQK